MLSRRLILSIAAAGLGGLVVAAGSANAGTATLGGWTASWNNAPGTDFSVNFTPGTGGAAGTVVFTKTATFGPGRVDAATGAILPIDVVFQQTTFAAEPLLIINSEAVTNSTGKTWNGFRIDIVDATTGASNQASFDTTTNFGTFSPFGTANVGTSLATFTNGSLASGATWSPTSPTGTGLTINALPTRSGAFKVFVLEEQPTVGGGAPIPLPAAAWTGLSGLMGLGLFGAAKRLRALIS